MLAADARRHTNTVPEQPTHPHPHPHPHPAATPTPPTLHNSSKISITTCGMYDPLSLQVVNEIQLTAEERAQLVNGVATRLLNEVWRWTPEIPGGEGWLQCT